MVEQHRSWARDKRDALRAAIRTTLDEGKRVYEGSLDAQARRVWGLVTGGGPQTEAGDLLVSPDTPSLDSLPRLIKRFALEPLLDQFGSGKYGWSSLTSDLLASLTNAFLLIPGGIAYGFLARVPSVVGLTSCIIPPAVYFLFGNSRQLSVGPDALTSIMTGVVIEREVALHGANPVQVASTLALLTGLFCILLSILKAGFIDNIISGFLLTGFVTGIAVLILAEQLPSLLGIPISVAGDFATYEKLRLSFTNLYRIHLPTLAVGLSSLTLLYALAYIFKVLGAQGRPWIHRIPVVVLVMFLSILVSALGNLSALGVPVLGVFEHALTTPSAPFLTTELMARLFIDVVMLTLTGFIQMQSVTRTFSIKNDYNVSGDRELFAIGTANVVGACFGGYTVFGSLPRSRIMDLSGSKTTLANLFSAVWVLIALYALHPVLRYIPKATLAAIIFKAATALIEFRDIRFILRIHAWTDLAMFLSTFLITFTSTISNGIIMCLLLATLIIIRKISAADLSIMGHMSPQEHRKAALTETASHGLYLDIKEHPDAQVSEGILILSIRGPLVFYNCGTLPRTIDVLTKTDMELLKRQRLVSLDKTETVMIPMTRANRSSSMIVMDDGAIKSRVFSLDENRLSNESLAASRRSLSRGLSMPRIRHTRSQSEPLAVHRTPSETLSTHFEPDLHPYVIIMDFARCTDLDSSAMLVLDQVIASYKHKKTAFLLTGLHPFHHRLFNKAGLVLKLGEENLFETLEEAIVAVKKRRV